MLDRSMKAYKTIQLLSKCKKKINREYFNTVRVLKKKPPLIPVQNLKSESIKTTMIIKLCSWIQ